MMKARRSIAQRVRLRALGIYRALAGDLLDLGLRVGDPAGFRRAFAHVYAELRWDRRPTARRLHELAARGPGEGAIVEIGSYLGNSTIYLALGSLAAGREKVHAVDPHTELSMAQVPDKERTSEKFLVNLDRFGVHQHVVYHRQASVEAAQAWDGGPVRLLYIDGLHTFDAVVSDFTSWYPHLSTSHVVVFDDYLWVEVASAVEHLRSRFRPYWYAVRGGQAIFATQPLSVRSAGLW